MPHPVASNGTTAAAPTVGTFTVSWTHVATANQTIYVYIAGVDEDLTGNAVETCTFGGVAMKELFRVGTVFGASGRSAYLFSLINPTPGSATILFTSTISSDWSGLAFNVLDGTIDGSCVLPGFYQDTPVTTLTKKGYGWESDGLLVCVGGYTATINLTGGTTIIAGAQLKAQYVDAADTEYSFTATRSAGGALTLFSFLIPHVSQSLSGGDPHIWFQQPTDLSNLAAGSSLAVGIPAGGESSGPARRGGLMLQPGTIRSIAAIGKTALLATKKVTLELMRGLSADSSGAIGLCYAIPTGITITIDGDGATPQVASLDGVNLPFYRWERFGWRFKNTGTGVLPGPGVDTYTVAPSILVEYGSTEPHAQQYGNGPMSQTSSTVDQASTRAMLHPMGVSPWGTIAQQDKSLVDVDCVVNQAVYEYQDSVTPATDHQYYMVKNGIQQDGTGGTVDTVATLIADSMGPALARRSFSLTYAPGNFAGHVGYRRTGGGTLRQSATVKVTPTTPGQILLAGTTDGAGTDRIVQLNSSQDEFTTTLANESRFLLVVPPLTFTGNDFHILGLRAAIENLGPGSGRSWSVTLRKNLVDGGMTPLVIADLATTGVTAGDVAYASGDTVSELWDAINAPLNSLYQFYTLLGFLAPPVADTGRIQVIKDAGGDVTTLFDFLAGGGLTPTGFQLVGGGVQVFVDLPPGSGYSILETPLPTGWTLTSITVSNGSDPTAISVAAGETVTLTFTNEQCPGELSGLRLDGLPYAPPAIAPCEGGSGTWNGGGRS